MHVRRFIGLVSTLGAVVCAEATVLRADTPAARTLMADQLLDDARSAVRNTRMPVELANRQAMALLQVAHQLAPDSPDVTSALAEAAEVAKQPDVQQDALKNLVRLTPDNLVAQVQFLDLLAQRRNTVEQKISIYQAAFDSAGLDSQVRSEMAVRLYRLLQQRGLTDDANADLKQALELNDVNVGAWQELCGQLAHTPDKTAEYLQALTNLLQANPYQPDALAAGAEVLAAHNEHSLAADWLSACVEQLHGTDVPPSVEQFEMLADELAAANRRTELDLLLQNMLSQEHPSLPVRLLAYTLHAPQGVVPGLAADPLVDPIRKDLAAAVAADPKYAQAQIDSLWFDLFYAPAVPADVDTRIKTLEKLVTAADLRYQRLRGWQFLRAGKLNAAKEVFTPIAPQDAYAAFGLIRIAEHDGDAKAVAAQLQDIYSAHPTGLFAVHVINEARQQNVTLLQTALGQSLHNIAANYPSLLLTIQRQPRDIALIEASLSKRRYNFGEPVILDVTITNTSEHALSVGPSGAIKVGVAVGATLRGLGAQELGFSTVENSPRIFRLERHSSLVEHVRVDDGLLRDVLLNNPSRLMNVGLILVSEPRGALNHIAVGLGGQVISGISFERDGFLQLTLESVNKMVTDLPTLPLEQRMLDSGALSVWASLIKDDANNAAADGGDIGDGAAAQPSMAQVKESIVEALVAQLQGQEPLETAWLLRVSPVKDVPASLKDALDKTETSPSTLVRMEWARRRATMAINDPDSHDDAVSELRKYSAGETDPQAKQWATALVAQLTLPPPATAPAPLATQPVSRPWADTQPAATTAPAASIPASTSAPATSPASTEPAAGPGASVDMPVSGPTATPSTTQP